MLMAHESERPHRQKIPRQAAASRGREGKTQNAMERVTSPQFKNRSG